MDALSIIAVSLGVGVLVYALSLRAGDAPADGTATPRARRSRFAWLRPRKSRPTGEDLGFGDAQPSDPGQPASEGFVYVPVLATGGPQWRTRVGGVIGLLVMVAVGALLLALAAVQIGHVVNRMVAGFLGR